MSSWFARIRNRFRGVVTALNLYPDVGKDVYPARKYRPAPVSAPAPELSLNFPQKVENLAETTYATRKPRLAAQAGVKHSEYSNKPTEDFRNTFYAPNAKTFPLHPPSPIRVVFEPVNFHDGDRLQ